MKSVRLVAFVFFVMTLVISCTKEEPVADEPEKEQVGQKNDEANDEAESENDNNAEGESNDPKGENPDPVDENKPTENPTNPEVPGQVEEPEIKKPDDNAPSTEIPVQESDKVAQLDMAIINGQLKVELYNEFAQKESKHGGVVVKLLDKGKTYSAKSNDNGICTFQDLGGSYKVTIYKAGYYCPPSKDGTLKLYKKATGYVTDLKATIIKEGKYEGKYGISAKLNNMVIPSGVKYIYLRFFVDESQSNVSKSNYDIHKFIIIPVTAIKDNQLTVYYDEITMFCPWRTNLNGSKKYLACYVTNAIPETTGIWADDNFANGVDNSGVGSTKSNSVYMN